MGRGVEFYLRTQLKSVMEDQTAEPRIEYGRRMESRRAESAGLTKKFRKVGVLRLASLITGMVLVWLAFNGAISWWLLLPAAACFWATAEWQSRITRARGRSERAAAFYEHGLARLDDRWAGRGETGERFLQDDHLYAKDLDLFGRGSLFELLSTARTRAGQETLAGWLLAPSLPSVVRARQAAVAELRPRLGLREDLALLGEDARPGEDSQALAAWAQAAPWHVSAFMRITAIAIALLSAVTLILALAGYGWIPFLIAFISGRAFAYRLRSRVQHVIGAVDETGRNLTLLSELLSRLEQERFTSPRLRELRGALDVEGTPPSRQIARLNRLIDLLDARRNMVFALAAVILLWPVQCAFAIERWRQRSGPAVGRWLAAVGELEALSSLACYSYEHPHDPFPELIEGERLFEGEGLGHPLIPEGRNVRTSLSLCDEPCVLIVSGSNMSGKSTLLRTVGINSVMALAGAPVRARRLHLSPLAVAASIHIQDSLQAGASRFYAEIIRLRQIVELTKGTLPVLFLLDEILHGTNSHDRRIGAESLVHGLVKRGAIGLVTTHDLALARIADELAPRAANVHFEDHLEGDRITFDYRLRDGVVERSNALQLMRSIGIEV